jgi:hypothetical protein
MRQKTQPKMNITSDRLKELFEAALKAENSVPKSSGFHPVGEGLDRERTNEEIAFHDFTEQLTTDEKKDVLALMWLGLRKGFDSFQSARTHVAMRHDTAHEIRTRQNLIVTSILDGLRIQIK